MRKDLRWPIRCARASNWFLAASARARARAHHIMRRTQADEADARTSRARITLTSERAPISVNMLKRRRNGNGSICRASHHRARLLTSRDQAAERRRLRRRHRCCIKAARNVVHTKNRRLPLFNVQKLAMIVRRLFASSLLLIAAATNLTTSAAAAAIGGDHLNEAPSKNSTSKSPSILCIIYTTASAHESRVSRLARCFDGLRAFWRCLAFHNPRNLVKKMRWSTRIIRCASKREKWARARVWRAEYFRLTLFAGFPIV